MLAILLRIRHRIQQLHTLIEIAHGLLCCAVSGSLLVCQDQKLYCLLLVVAPLIVIGQQFVILLQSVRVQFFNGLPYLLMNLLSPLHK